MRVRPRAINPSGRCSNPVTIYNAVGIVTEMAERKALRRETKVGLDGIDDRILEVLQTEPRITNKALGLALSMTEGSVASRIRAMEAQGLMRVVAQLDFRALGYTILALIDVTVANRKIDDVAKSLSTLDGVGSVTIMLGDPAIIIQVHAKGIEELQNLIVSKIATVVGVQQVETNLLLDIAKWQPGSAQLRPNSHLYNGSRS